MFVVHTIYENEGNTTRDYGHVNQFFRCNPEFRAQKDERIFKKCVELCDSLKIKYNLFRWKVICDKYSELVLNLEFQFLLNFVTTSF